MVLVNGKATDEINISDRGLQYGDGLFETISYRNNGLEFLNSHIDRLILGCEKLSIPFQQADLLLAELETLCHELNHDAVVKIIITRGSGGRGYKTQNNVEPTRIISTHPYPEYPQSYFQQGVSIRFCRQTLADNKTLAGIKHLNRLEQILARNEWDSTEIVEGLMSDNHGNIIEGTMSNLFIICSGQLITPLLKQSGVAGIIRAQLIKLANQNNLFLEEKKINKQDIADADEAFICNSVMGIIPINHIVDGRTYRVGPITQQLQQLLQNFEK